MPLGGRGTSVPEGLGGTPIKEAHSRSTNDDQTPSSNDLFSTPFFRAQIKVSKTTLQTQKYKKWKFLSKNCHFQSKKVLICEEKVTLSTSCCFSWVVGHGIIKKLKTVYFPLKKEVMLYLKSSVRFDEKSVERRCCSLL